MPAQSVQALRGQFGNLADACAATADRDVAALGRVLLTGFTPDHGRPLESLGAFVDFAGRHREPGFSEPVIHWPIPDSDFAAEQKVFEQIAMKTPAELAGPGRGPEDAAESSVSHLCTAPHCRTGICARMAG